MKLWNATIKPFFLILNKMVFIIIKVISLYILGMLLVELGEFEQALLYFNNAIEHNPTDFIYYENKGF